MKDETCGYKQDKVSRSHANGHSVNNAGTWRWTFQIHFILFFLWQNARCRMGMHSSKSNNQNKRESWESPLAAISWKKMRSTKNMYCDERHLACRAQVKRKGVFNVFKWSIKTKFHVHLFGLPAPNKQQTHFTCNFIPILCHQQTLITLAPDQCFWLGIFPP